MFNVNTKEFCVDLQKCFYLYFESWITNIVSFLFFSKCFLQCSVINSGGVMVHPVSNREVKPENHSSRMHCMWLWHTACQHTLAQSSCMNIRSICMWVDQRNLLFFNCFGCICCGLKIFVYKQHFLNCHCTRIKKKILQFSQLKSVLI